MKTGWRIGRVFGIDINIDSSWVVIFVLFSWSMAGGYFPRQYPHWTKELAWAMGVMTSLLVFASVLVHELAHSLVAIRQPLHASALYLALINVGLGIFNLLPGFPLDGGRVFRAIVWKATGDLKKATRAASRSGQAFAFLFIFLGLFPFL